MNIVYFNQLQLKDPRLSSTLAKFPHHSWNNINHIKNYSFVPRVGSSIMPIKNTIINRLDFQMPEYDPTFNQTFADITDKRCLELLKTYTTHPWLIHWSGGVDSTLMLTSILKNTTKADRENMYVTCNSISVYENPKFYYNHVLPNFKIIDSSSDQLSLKQLKNYHSILGEFNDQLHSGSISISMIHTNPKELYTDFLASPDRLIEYLGRYFKNQETGKWFYQQHIENIQQTTIPMSTYYDFFWYHFFNNVWVSVKLRAAVANKDFGAEFMDYYLSNWICWFETKDYQRWAMIADNRTPPVHLGKCKPESKKYIYDYNHDEYYYEFKTKTTSISNLTERVKTTWFCMLDDFTTLNLNDNLDQILELLPNYINPAAL